MNSTINRSKLAFENIDCFITELCSNDLNIDIDIAVSVSKTSPKFEIWFNDRVIFNEYVSTGNHALKFNIDEVDKFCKLTLKMSNKLDGETIVENGKIIKDTFISIRDLKINNCSLITDVDFFYNHLTYFVGKIPEPTKNGFWKNDSELVIEFQNPFILWYNEKTNKNASLAAPLIHKSKNYEFKNFTEEAKLEIVESLKKLNY